MKNARKILTSFIGLLLVTIAQAELKPIGSYNFLDTESELEWRTNYDLPKVNSLSGYNTSLSQFDAGSTYRFPTSAEVTNLLTEVFPNFVANDASGRCAEMLDGTGGYPELLSEAQAFLTLFRDSRVNTSFEGLYEDAGGTLRAIYVSKASYNNSATICLTGRYDNYEDFRLPPVPSNYTKSLVVRTAIDRKAASLTLYNYLAPTEVGLYARELVLGGNPVHECIEGETSGSTDAGWESYFIQGQGLGGSCYWDDVWGEFELASYSGDFAPWIKVNSLEYTGLCTAGDADIGAGWCRRSIAGAEWQFTGEYVIFPGTYINNQGSVDNIEIEQIWENMKVDFDPWRDTNIIFPKNGGWIIYLEIETTSIADGDAYDFNAANVDPSTLMAGPGLAPAIDYGATDIDGDGDTDYTFKFIVSETGVSCLDEHITIAGRTYGGEPIAGRDILVTAGCTDPVDIDVDPFNPVNIVRPNDDYNVTVAVLGMRAASGDVVDLFPGGSANVADGLDAESLRVGPAETPVVGTPIIIDVDGDSFDDMLVNFNAFDAGIACGDTELEVVGNKNSGLPIRGVDAIVTEDCATSSCHP